MVQRETKITSIELAGGSSYRGFELPRVNVWRNSGEIDFVSSWRGFELSEVDCKTRLIDGIFDYKWVYIGNSPSTILVSRRGWMDVYSRAKLKRMALTAFRRRNGWIFLLKLHKINAKIRKTYRSVDVIYFLKSNCKKKTSVYLLKPCREIGHKPTRS